MKIDVVGIRLVKEREIDYDKSIHQPIDTVNFVLEEMQDLDREMCMTLNLDANNCVLNAHVVSVGGLDRAVVDVNEKSRAFIKSAELQLPINLINALSTSYDKQCLTKSQVEQDLSKSKSYGSETQLDEVKEDVEEYEMDIAEDRW